MRAYACTRERRRLYEHFKDNGRDAARHHAFTFMKTLVIAEKPSVAQDIVRALTPVAGKFDKHDEHFESDKYIVTSAVGHLVEIQAPEEFDVKRGKWSFTHLPVIPPYFDLKRWTRPNRA